ncbi:cold shock domain-containing protein [Rhodococcus sp. D-46]|uniref:cold-shock protein n=1 Tax=Rhodococcus TaxID=1827 RepID=UPI0013F631A7|nr:cold shock domain-containing protein [Rhodococcus qingshengii]NHE67596.1 cold shock domain-containing protein [Rhodococcus sp. D-46]
MTNDPNAIASDKQISGHVEWFNQESGFGFIAPDGAGPSVFVHHSEIAGSGFRTLDEGEPVTYDLDVTTHPPQARNVHKNSRTRCTRAEMT